jgi:hypothetical protein
MQRFVGVSAPRSCKGDGGRPSEAALQGEASNRLKLLWSKAMVVGVDCATRNSSRDGKRKPYKCSPRRGKVSMHVKGTDRPVVAMISAIYRLFPRLGKGTIGCPNIQSQESAEVRLFQEYYGRLHSVSVDC